MFLFTSKANFLSVVINIDCEKTSCSACDNKSIAVQSGLLFLSATTVTSDGPAIMSIPTSP